MGSLAALVNGDDRWVTCALLGLGTSLSVLTKQDFWAPSLAAVVCGIFYAPLRFRPIVVAAAVGPALVGYGAVAVRLGPHDFLAMLGGFGHAAELGNMGLPSGRTITAELGATSLVLGFGLLVVRPRARTWWLVALGLGTGAILAYLAAEGLDGLALFMEDVQLRVFSIFLPAIALLWLWRTRDTADPTRARLARVLLFVCMAARMRRGFQGIEWYHAMLELPAYVLTIRAVMDVKRIHLQRLAIATLIPVGLYLHWDLGKGPLTARGRRTYEIVETPRGRIVLNRNQARTFRYALAAVVGLDPSGNRSLFSFGYSGGWNYFLNRANPTSAPQGFRFTRQTPDIVLMHAAAAGPIVFDPGVFQTIKVRDVWAELLRWQAPPTASVYMRFDRRYFKRLIAGCPLVSKSQDTEIPFLTVYDCADTR